jgi:3-oxoacyl-(acyl-carrier-protein) synthase
MKRVVVSGIGLVTSIGSTLETFWHGLMTRTSALSPLKKSDYTALGCTSPISAGKVEISASVIESLTVFDI